MSAAATGGDALLIRTAKLDDAAELAEYAARLFAEELPGIFHRTAPTLAEEIDFIRTHLGPPTSTMLVAETSGRIVGMLGFTGNTLAEEAHAGTFGISVDREARGTGVGSALIEALFEWAPRHGITRIVGYSWANNPRATALYERLGFEREGLLRDAIVRDGEHIDVLALARLLPAVSA